MRDPIVANSPIFEVHHPPSQLLDNCAAYFGHGKQQQLVFFEHNWARIPTCILPNLIARSDSDSSVFITGYLCFGCGGCELLVELDIEQLSVSITGPAVSHRFARLVVLSSTTKSASGAPTEADTSLGQLYSAVLRPTSPACLAPLRCVWFCNFRLNCCCCLVFLCCC